MEILRRQKAGRGEGGGERKCTLLTLLNVKDVQESWGACNRATGSFYRVQPSLRSAISHQPSRPRPGLGPGAVHRLPTAITSSASRAQFSPGKHYYCVLIYLVRALPLRGSITTTHRAPCYLIPLCLTAPFIAERPLPWPPFKDIPGAITNIGVSSLLSSGIFNIPFYQPTI